MHRVSLRLLLQQTRTHHFHRQMSRDLLLSRRQHHSALSYWLLLCRRIRGASQVSLGFLPAQHLAIYLSALSRRVLLRTDAQCHHCHCVSRGRVLCGIQRIRDAMSRWHLLTVQRHQVQEWLSQLLARLLLRPEHSRLDRSHRALFRRLLLLIRGGDSYTRTGQLCYHMQTRILLSCRLRLSGTMSNRHIQR